MLIYNIKTQVEFDLGYNTQILTELWAFYKNIVQKLVSAKNLKDCIYSIYIWHVDMQNQNTGQVRFGLQSTNF